MTEAASEGLEPQASPDDAGDPAAAFEALRHAVEKQGGQLGAEMTIIRRGVEAAFDQFDNFRQPPDYGPDLAHRPAARPCGGALEAIEQLPVLRHGPEHYARAFERSGENLVRTAAQQLEGRGA